MPLPSPAKAAPTYVDDARRNDDDRLQLSGSGSRRRRNRRKHSQAVAAAATTTPVTTTASTTSSTAAAAQNQSETPFAATAMAMKCFAQDGYLSSDEELLIDQDVVLLKESMKHAYKEELSDMRTIIWYWSERIDTFLEPYIGFSLFLAPERQFKISRFAGLATVLFAVVLVSFIAGGGRYGCAICTKVYPLHQSWKFLRAVGGTDGKGAGAREGEHRDSYIQWATYWVLVGCLDMLEQIMGALFFSHGFHWLYWYIKLLVLVYCYFPRTQGATVIFWKAEEWWKNCRDLLSMSQPSTATNTTTINS